MRASITLDYVLRAGAVLFVVVAADSFTKELAESHLTTPVALPLGTRLALSYNRGTAFGALAGAPPALTVGLGVACAIVVTWAMANGRLRLNAIVLGLISGGAVANVVDRVPDGRVTDFIDLPYWPSFNLAEAAITAAAVMIVLLSGRSDSTAR